MLDDRFDVVAVDEICTVRVLQVYQLAADLAIHGHTSDRLRQCVGSCKVATQDS